MSIELFSFEEISIGLFSLRRIAWSELCSFERISIKLFSFEEISIELFSI